MVGILYHFGFINEHSWLHALSMTRGAVQSLHLCNKFQEAEEMSGYASWIKGSEFTAMVFVWEAN